MTPERSPRTVHEATAPGASAVFLWLALGISPALGATPPLDAFAARPVVHDVTISPNGRYLAMIHGEGDAAVVLSVDRLASGAGAIHALFREPDRFRLNWCRFASDRRVLCSLRGVVHDADLDYYFTRLVAVDVDGGHLKVLLQDAARTGDQFQDAIIDWHPGPPDTVLIAASEVVASWNELQPEADFLGARTTGAYPAVFELNVVTGKLSQRSRSRTPIRSYATDGHGEVRLAWGRRDTEESWFARLRGETAWRELTRYRVFDAAKRPLEPLAISRDDPNKAFAVGGFEGHDALWLIDLADKDDPKLVFAHPAVDVALPVRDIDGSLLGVRYDTDYPAVYYADRRAQALIHTVGTALPATFNSFADRSSDGTLHVVRAESDVEEGAYYLLDETNGKLTGLGSAHPDLDPAALARMRPISYRARDGVEVPGYLTLPPGARPEHLPLIVMPHGGPIDRDTVRFWFLTQFLATRGYAVLQMNFRGSSGYGYDWFHAAHQDWGGLTYDDVTDAARWAVKEGIADPQRMCIVGWSFGGYVAELAAVRNPDLYKCAVSIAGISDLTLLLTEGRFYLDAELQAAQIGTVREKLKRDSPRLHAADVRMPVLLVHGDRDANVQFEQSQAMDKALTRAGKPHRFVVIHGADHQLPLRSDRITLLREIDAFLSASLGGASSH